MQAHLWISLACRANISSTGPVAGIAQQVLLITESPYELALGSFWWRKPGEVAVLEQDMAPLDLTCKQDLKCVLVALFEYVFIIE